MDGSVLSKKDVRFITVNCWLNKVFELSIKASLANENVFQKIAILGTGLLGASILQAARERKLAHRHAAWSRREATRAFCVGQPWCDSVHESPEECVRGADLVLVCVPVDQIPVVLAAAAPGLEAGALVSDVGSTKSGVCREAQRVVPERAVFIGSHPMAGSEKSGPEHASAGLFEGRTCFVTPTARQVGTAELGGLVRFWRALGMDVVETSPEEHDAIAARTSHLPHFAACVLAGVLGRHPARWSALAGPGLRDTTRVAGGDPEMWRAIAAQNREAILAAFDEFQAEFAHVRQYISEGQLDSLQVFLEQSRAWRNKL
jgi:prephenate dehydrogenase